MRPPIVSQGEFAAIGGRHRLGTEGNLAPWKLDARSTSRTAGEPAGAFAIGFGRVRACGSPARSAARRRGLPDFESAWVDALAQARVITPFQAAEINAGRGEALAVGPYVIARPLPSPGYAACYRAKSCRAGRDVRLYRCHAVLQVPAAVRRKSVPASWSSTFARSKRTHLCAIEDAGVARRAGVGRYVARSGESRQRIGWRKTVDFRRSSCLHIAREMLARLARARARVSAHGDLGAAVSCSIRRATYCCRCRVCSGIVRPHEGYSFNDLPPEAYDYLSPERIADGGPPTLAGDIYACGCLWWHLLTGRTPLGRRHEPGQAQGRPCRQDHRRATTCARRCRTAWCERFRRVWPVMPPRARHRWRSSRPCSDRGFRRGRVVGPMPAPTNTPLERR